MYRDMMHHAQNQQSDEERYTVVLIMYQCFTQINIPLFFEEPLVNHHSIQQQYTACDTMLKVPLSKLRTLKPASFLNK